MSKPELDFYDVKLRRKINLTEYDIVRTKNNRFMAKGVTPDGRSVTRFVSADFVQGNGFFDDIGKSFKKTIKHGTKTVNAISKGNIRKALKEASKTQNHAWATPLTTVPSVGLAFAPKGVPKKELKKGLYALPNLNDKLINELYARRF